MNLKDGFRYQNFLKDKIYEIEMFLMNRNNTTTIKETHNKKDGIEVVYIPEMKDYDVNIMLDLLVAFLDEKETIDKAIHTAKSGDFDLDSIISENKIIHNVLDRLTNLKQIKSTEKRTIAKGYTFNNEGNETQYTYDVQEVTTIDFDRTKVVGMLNHYNKICDDNSNAVDYFMINTILDFKPRFDVNSTLDDCYNII